jgi:hypothetical protein
MSPLIGFFPSLCLCVFAPIGRFYEPFSLHLAHSYLKPKLSLKLGPDNIIKGENQMKRLIALCLVFVCGITPALSASNFDSVPPGNWGKVESLPRGTEISVKMRFGDKMNGEYMGLDADAIRLNIDKKESIYPKKDIGEVRLLNVSDSNLNGVLTGFAIGAIPPSILLGKYFENETGEGARGALMGIAIGGGIGALIGYLWDNLDKGTELIYRAP